MSNPSNPPKPDAGSLSESLSKLIQTDQGFYQPDPKFPTQDFPVALGPEIKEAHSTLEARILQIQYSHQRQADKLSQMAQVLNHNPELAELIDSLFYLNPNPSP